MPPKRKAGEPVRYTSSKRKRADEYQKVAKKDEYGYSSKSDAAYIQAAVKAEARKQLNGSIETQYSQVLISMDSVSSTTSSGLLDSGFALPGLNQLFVPGQVVNNNGTAVNTNPSNLGFGGAQMLVFNLSALSQVRGSGPNQASGYRVGNKINAGRLTLKLYGAVVGPITDSTYHVMIVRRKDNAGAGTYQVPRIMDASVSQLFKGITDGPLATSNVGDGSTVPAANWLSMTRRNYDSYTFTTGAHKYQSVRIQPDGSSSGSDFSAQVTVELTHDFNEVWDFTSNLPGAPVLKNGDYFAFVWREGPNDRHMVQALRLYANLSFKDTGN